MQLDPPCEEIFKSDLSGAHVNNPEKVGIVKEFLFMDFDNF